jgi:Type I phosphodiesterase / nucleotide pyrophosphatase
VALVVSAVFVLGVIFASLALVRPQAPPDLPAASAAHGPLTQHLLFVIIDGLRYDLATNPERMPSFAEAMRTKRSAEVMSGPLSITSAAIQNFGSGQPGQLEQIVHNLSPDPVRYESWMGNARRLGRSTTFAGDATWIKMFGAQFGRVWLDPPGMAIDYDYSDVTFANARKALATSPDLLIVHFAVSDHQMHFYGVQSAGYRRHIRELDTKLFGLLAELGPDWTVVVTSDHGANDAGDHGSDVPIQRRTPLFAYGPGIAPPTPAAAGIAEPKPKPLDQADVAGTLAALLGAPAGVHSQGHLLSDWLDITPHTRARLALHDVARVLRFAGTLDAREAARLEAQRSELETKAATEPAAVASAARSLATQARALILANQGAFSAHALWLFGGICAGALLVARAWLGRVSLGTIVGAVLVTLLSIALTAYVENLPGAWPKRTVGILFGVFNLPTLLLLVQPERFVALLDKLGRFAPLLVPGALAVSYPRNLQPIAFAVCLIVPLVVLAAGSTTRWGISGPGQRREGRLLDLSLLVTWGLALFPAGWHPNGLSGFGWNRSAPWLLAVSAVLLAALALELWRGAPHSIRGIALGCGLFAASVLLRRVAPAWFGRPLLIVLPLLAVLQLRRGGHIQGFFCLLVGYAWVSREVELPTVLAAVGLSTLVARRSAALMEAGSQARWLTLLAFWFVLAFVLRLGVSGGMDPTNLDMAAGAFGAKDVSLTWLTCAVIWKTFLAQVLLGLSLLAPLGARPASALARGFAVIGAARAVALLGMLQLSNGSFWTSLRVIGDLPYTVIFFVAAGGAWLCHRQLQAAPGQLQSAPQQLLQTAQ